MLLQFCYRRGLEVVPTSGLVGLIDLLRLSMLLLYRLFSSLWLSLERSLDLRDEGLSARDTVVSFDSSPSTKRDFRDHL